MAVMKYTRVTPEERAEIEKYLRSGMTQKEISMRTKRSCPTIRKIKDELEAKKNEELEQKRLEEEEKAKANGLAPIVNSDYAKARADGDPRFQSSLKIEKALTIHSPKTGFTYKTNKDSDVVEVSIDDELLFSIPKCKINAFADELIDVAIEVSNY